MGTHWEYAWVDTVISGSMFADSQKQFAEWMDGINRMGAEGWEMVSDTIIYGQGGSNMQWPGLLFKRQL